MAIVTVEEEIRAFNAEYAECIDADKLERWPDFFVEDCIYKVTNAENVAEGLPIGLIFANSKGMLKDRVSALREANIYEKQHYRHILSLPNILATDEGSLHVKTPFLIIRTVRKSKSEFFLSGYYDDVMVRVGERWKLAKRIAVCDSVDIDTLLAIPL